MGWVYKSRLSASGCAMAQSRSAWSLAEIFIQSKWIGAKCLLCTLSEKSLCFWKRFYWTEKWELSGAVFKIFAADAGTVIFSLSQDTVNWSHFGPTHGFLTSAQKFIIKNHQLGMACQVTITEEVKAFFCIVSPAAFRAVYNCIFTACDLCSACILERDWNIFWFQLLITTKLLSMGCPL